MSCKDTPTDLLSFQLGLLEGAERDAAEAHLLACRECLAEYLALKRSAELPAEVPPPSEHARARLRRAVSEELRRKGPAWSWWERPLALTLAAASVWLALGAVHTLATREGRAPHGAVTSPPRPPSPERERGEEKLRESGLRSRAPNESSALLPPLPLGRGGPGG